MLNEQHQKELNNILDCFTGADGGISFVRLRTSLSHWEKENTPSGDKLVDVMSMFSRLIDAVKEK